MFEDEPTGGKADFNDTELADLITCTPHVGASTDQSTAAVADEVINIIKAYKNTGKPLNGVNQRQKSTAQNNLVVRHFNQVGVLAGVFDALRYEKINIEEMENMIFAGGKAASCTLKLDKEPKADAAVCPPALQRRHDRFIREAELLKPQVKHYPFDNSGEGPKCLSCRRRSIMRTLDNEI